MVYNNLDGTNNRGSIISDKRPSEGLFDIGSSFVDTAAGLIGGTDSGVNVIDSLLGSLGLSTTKKEKLYDWQARREWALNKAYEMSKYNWQKQGLINAGINPLIAMSSGSSNNTVNNSANKSSQAGDSSGGVLSLIGALLKAFV